jgi:hypothetical protein
LHKLQQLSRTKFLPLEVCPEAGLERLRARVMDWCPRGTPVAKGLPKSSRRNSSLAFWRNNERFV